MLRNDDTEKVIAADFSADVFFETDNSVVAIELKTVKPNSGGMMGEKQKILEGKTVLFHLFPDKSINFYFGFPFDPTANSATNYDKSRFLNSIVNANKFVAQEEVLLSNELWNFLSGAENTMEEILDIINAISTIDFLTKYQFLKDNSKRNTPEYLLLLREWNLFSEFQLITKNNVVKEKLDAKTTRIYNKICFDKDGKYNWERYNDLKELL